jgi:hypothetical protein
LSFDLLVELCQWHKRNAHSDRKRGLYLYRMVRSV